MVNLKTLFLADTSNLKKGSQEAKACIKDFEKVSSDSLSQLAGLFGVNTGQVHQLANAAKGAAMSIGKSFNASSESVSLLAAGIKTAAAGAAGLVVIQAIASWKELNAEAEHFFASMDGNSLKVGMDAYVSTLKAASMEMRNIGQSAENLVAFQKWLARTTTTIKEGFVGMLGFSVSGASGIRGIFENVVGTLTVGKEKAAEAETIMKRMTELGNQLAQNEYKVYEYEQKIAELKRQAKDESESLATRSAAIAEAQNLIKQRTEVLAPIYKELATLQEQYNGLTLTSVEDQRKVTEYKKQAAMMSKAENDQLRETFEVQKTITREIQKQADIQQAALEAMNQMAAGKAELSQFSANVSQAQTLSVAPKIESAALMSGIEQMQAYADANPITLNADVKAKFEDMQMQLANINQQLTSALQNAVAAGLSGLGEAIGAAVTGAEEPGAVLLSTVANLMKQLGELAIGAGVAMLGIKAALESLNPYAAIAAGVALVALAAVVSSTASNMGSSIGGSSTGSTSYTSSYRFGTNGLQSSSVQELRITGTLKADGDQLVAVLDNTATKNYYTR